MKRYNAPWCTSLVVMSVFAVVLCFAIAFGTPYLPASKHGGEIGMTFRWLPLALIAGCALFTIRGYSITPDSVLVHRLWWATRLPRAGLRTVEVVPNAMCKSIRTFGNGGCFSFTGYYRNKALGSYRALVTDLKQTVVLRYEKRTYVLSPSDPEAFVKELTPIT